MRNHLGSYECKLCLTLHNNEGNYLAHTQGKWHQTNLAKRAAREAKDAPAQPQPHKRKVSVKKSVKIGRPGYKTIRSGDETTLFFSRFCTRKLKITPSHGIDSCLHSSRGSKLVTRDTSISYLLLNHMKLLDSRIPARKLIKWLTSSSLTGIPTPRCLRFTHTFHFFPFLF